MLTKFRSDLWTIPLILLYLILFSIALSTGWNLLKFLLQLVIFSHLWLLNCYSDPFTKNNYDTIFILSYLLCKDYPYNFFYPNNLFSCLDHQGLACKIIGVWCVKSLDYSTEPFRGRHTLESHWTSKYYILHSTVNGAIIV